MAEKHKSKYKKPENTKYKSRRDLKDYTEDDKKGTLNPKSTGEKQQNVLRKTDKEFIDTGDMYVKYNADDRLYKDLEDGEYDPKHAAKVLKKRQDKDEKDNAKNIKDKIENLTREGKERLVREYIRRKINMLLEADEPATDEPGPAEEPTAETPAPPVNEPAPTDIPTPDVAAPADIPAPDAAAPAPDQQAPAETNSSDYSGIIDTIANKENTVFRVNALLDIINGTAEKLQPKQRESLLRILKIQVIKLDRSLDINKEK